LVISTSGLVAYYSRGSRWEADPRKHRCSRWNFVHISFGSEETSISSFEAVAILIYPIPVWSHSILVSSNGKPDPEYIPIVVGISLISCPGVEKHEILVWSPPYWFYPLSVWSRRILVGSNGKPVPKNIGVAVRISSISGL